MKTSMLKTFYAFRSGFVAARSVTARRARRTEAILGSRIHTTSRLSDIFTVQDESDFTEKVVKNKKPVVVEFHATWCGPCKMLMPRMEKAMVKYNDKIDMAKVDIDELPDLAMEYNVGAVPSVILLKDGGIIDKFVGLKDDDQLDTFLNNASKK